MRSTQALIILAAAAATVHAQKLNAVAWQLQVAAPPVETTIPYQYGVMFEDINHSGDGGIYAELINNRAFQANSFEEASVNPWFGVGGAKLSLRQTNWLSIALPFYINVAAPSGPATSLNISIPTAPVGLSNPGWWGISVTPQTYTGSFYVMGTYSGNFTVTLKSNVTSAIWATTSVSARSIGTSWTQVQYTLKPTASAPDAKNVLQITFDSARATQGSLNFNLLSLFPETYNNRPNGMRKDLMEALSELSPSYLRFPGGNNIEGIGPPAVSPRWIWNETIGPLVNRPGRPGTWSYYNTDGLGLHEYFDWCTDLDMEPVYAVWSGLYLNGQIIPQNQLQPYIDEALAAIEYITGSTSTPMGALRAANGQVTPWKLKYVEVGNEDNLNNGANSYTSYRFPMFYSAIKARYPNITVMASFTPPIPAGAIGDYHIYDRPDEMVSRYHQSDGASAVTPAMVGEYAVVQNNTARGGGVDFGQPLNQWPYWIGSVAEAVYLLGLEVNAATIFGASYAPTFNNFNSVQWGTNMIGFDANPAHTVLSTSWHVIKLLSNTRFTTTRNVRSNLAAGPLYWAAGVNEDTGSNIMKLATYNTTGFNSVPVAVNFPGLAAGSTANLTVLTAPGPFSHGDIGTDPVISTTTTLTLGENGFFTFGMPNWAVAVLATPPKSGGDATGASTGYAGFGGYGGCKGGRPISTIGNGC